MFETPNTASHDFENTVKRAKEKISNLLVGEQSLGSGSSLEAVTRVAGRSQSASAAAQEREPIDRKERAHYNAAVRPLEEAALRTWAQRHGAWMNADDIRQRCKALDFIGSGAEQVVYQQADWRTVLKINTGVFHGTWLEYFVRLHIHNAIFPTVQYSLLAFTEAEGDLAAVVTQPFVLAAERVVREDVEDYLSALGFVRKKADDYHHPEHGIILEDLHDENVLQNDDGVLYFIDPVVYLETVDMKLAGRALFRFPFSTEPFTG